jgi:hypothetical protein
MIVRWWRVLAAWPLALVLSVAGTVLALWVTAALEDGSVGAPGDTLYIVLWVALLALPPALVVGVPVLTVTAVALRGTRLVWQVLAVSGVAAWVAAGWTTFLFSPRGPFRTGTVDPAAPYPWENVALHSAIAALAWALGTGAAWAAMQPVRPARAARTRTGPAPAGGPPRALI